MLTVIEGEVKKEFFRNEGEVERAMLVACDKGRGGKGIVSILWRGAKGCL